MILNYIEHLLTSACTFAICVSISAFAFIVGIPEGITSFAVELKIWVITARIKKYKTWWNSMLEQAKLNNIDVLTSKALSDHEKCISINNVLKVSDEIKEQIRNSNKKYVWCN